METIASLESTIDPGEQVLKKIKVAEVCQEKLLTKDGGLTFESRKYLDKNYPGVVDWLLKKRLVVETTIGGRVGEKVIQLAHEQLAQAIQKTLAGKKAIITPLAELKTKLIKRNKKIKVNLIIFIIVFILILLFFSAYARHLGQIIIDKEQNINKHKNDLAQEINIKEMMKSDFSKKLIEITQGSINLSSETSAKYLDLSKEAVRSEKIPLSIEHIKSAIESNENVLRLIAGLNKSPEWLSSKAETQVIFSTDIIKDILQTSEISMQLATQIGQNLNLNDASKSIEMFKTARGAITKEYRHLANFFRCPTSEKKSPKAFGNGLSTTEIYYYSKNTCRSTKPFIYKNNKDYIDRKERAPVSSISSNYDRIKDYYVLYGNDGIFNWGKLEDGFIKKKYLDRHKLTNIVPSISSVKLIEESSIKKDHHILTTLIGSASGDLIKINFQLITPVPNDNKPPPYVSERINIGTEIRSIHSVIQNGKKLLLVATKNEIQVRDVVSLKLFASLYSDSGELDSVAVTKDNTKIYAKISESNKILSYDLPLMIPELHKLDCNTGKPTSVAISPDLKHVLVGGYLGNEIEKLHLSSKPKDGNKSSCLKVEGKEGARKTPLFVERISFHNEVFKISGKLANKSLIGTGSISDNNQNIKTIPLNYNIVVNSISYDLLENNWIATTFHPSVRIGNQEFKGKAGQQFITSFSLPPGDPAKDIVIASRNKNGSSCLWSGQVPEKGGSLGKLCNVTQGKDKFLYWSDTKINWADINSSQSVIAVVNNAGHLVINSPTGKFENQTKYTQRKLWKVKFFNPSKDVELLVTIDYLGGLKFWKFTDNETKPRLNLVYSLNIPALKYHGNITQDMDIQCNTHGECLLAAPVIGNNNKKDTNNAVYLWKFKLEDKPHVAG